MATRKADAPAVRRAVQTRKSTEHRLEQEFNSLDARREAGDTCIAGRRWQRWGCLSGRYDDGGNRTCPVLKRLMADIGAGRVDGVVVYRR